MQTRKDKNKLKNARPSYSDHKDGCFIIRSFSFFSFSLPLAISIIISAGLVFRSSIRNRLHSSWVCSLHTITNSVDIALTLPCANPFSTLLLFNRITYISGCDHLKIARLVLYFPLFCELTSFLHLWELPLLLWCIFSVLAHFSFVIGRRGVLIIIIIICCFWKTRLFPHKHTEKSRARAKLIVHYTGKLRLP